MDGRVEIVEEFALHLVGDLRAPAGEGLVFLDDEKAVGFGDRGGDGGLQPDEIQVEQGEGKYDRHFDA